MAIEKCIKRDRGISMVELLVAIAVLGLSLGPLIGLLSHSNRASSASMYEVMAVHYAAEIVEQLQRLGPKLTEILADARTLSGNSSLTLDQLISDGDFHAALNTPTISSTAVNFRTGSSILDSSIVVSPMNENFRREITAKQLSKASNTRLITGEYWQINIMIKWNIDAVTLIEKNKAAFSFIVRI